MKIFFNVLVHTNNDIVEDLINNIFKYTENPVICLHVHTCFTDFDSERFGGIENVYINPQRFSHIVYANKIKALCSNHDFILENKVDFDYEIIFYSQMLFVKRGIENYLRGCDSCMVHSKLHASCHNFNSKECELFAGDIYKSLIEGLVFNFEISKKMYSLLKGSSLYDDRYMPVEEFAFPSAINMFSSQPNRNKRVPMNTQKRTHITFEEVKQIIHNEVKEISSFYYDKQSVDDIYIVHRVDYNYENPIRKYLRRL